jgi:hypothetical protein
MVILIVKKSLMPFDSSLRYDTESPARQHVLSTLNLTMLANVSRKMLDFEERF